MERNPFYSLNGIHLIWRYLRDSPNHQIKASTKYTMYTVVMMHVTELFVTACLVKDCNLQPRRLGTSMVRLAIQPFFLCNTPPLILDDA